jgi:hypothetical protein
MNKSKLKFKLSQLKRKIEELKKEKSETREISFKTLKETYKRPHWGILYKNKFYDIESTTDVKKEIFIDGGLLYTPILTQGIPITKDLSSELKNILSTLEYKNQYISLFVMPDSYSAMTIIKKYVQKNNVNSDWMPIVSLKECRLYPLKSGDSLKSE